MQHEDEMLDVQSVADLLHVNPRTVLRMVEREELPAIRVARRFRFRRSDLEHYLRTHLSTATSSQNGKTVKHNTPDVVEPTEETEQEEFDVPTWPRDEANGSHLKEQTRAFGAQSAKLRKQAAQLEIEQKLLEIEKQRVALRKEDLSRIDQALAIADRLVNMLQPEADAKTKATLLQTLLPTILQPEQSRSLESALSVLKRDAELETTATN
ncbi:MAG TPA: helix-turn-helix domain-containing protein [Ktedonobacteraceae bacterium]